MKKLSIAVGMLCLFGISASALAQSLFQRCENRKAEVQTMKDQVKQIDNEIANVNDQIRDLMQQMADLRRKKTAKKGQQTALQRKIRAEEASFNRMCGALSHCEAYERKIDRLKDRMKPMAERLHKIREEIGERGNELTRYDQAVTRIENSYAQLGCDNLVPGQTADSTVDRCTALFKEWNDMQADMNTLKRSVAALEGRYQRIVRKMRASNSELARLTRQMRASCSHSARISDLDDLEREHQGYLKMKDELRNMSSRIKKFRRPKIVKPVIRPRKKGKPVIHPKKKSKPVIRPK